MPDPSAPEYNGEVEAHLRWWQKIWEAQQRRGDTHCYVEPGARA